jgi:DNA-binding NarL/FixJ family response regulator
MPACETSIVIIAPAGPIRDGLETLVASVLPAGRARVRLCSAVPCELQASEAPDIALIDGGMFGAALGAAIGQLRAAWPRLRCLVLTDDRDQQSLARAAGAVAAILKDGRAAELVQAIERLSAG